MKIVDKYLFFNSSLLIILNNVKSIKSNINIKENGYDII